MLKNTFLHVPGLGIKSEQRIWSSGIHSWDSLLREDLKCFSLKRVDALRRSIEDSPNQNRVINLLLFQIYFFS
jgi:hypothetical protein